MGITRVSRILLVALFFVATLAGCDSAEPTVTFSIELTEPTLSTPAAGMQFVTVTAAGSWSIAFSDTTWCSINPQSGTGSSSDLVLSYSKNSTAQQRFVKVMAISEQNDTVNAVLVQAAGEEADVTPEEVGYPTYLELPAIDPTESQLFVSHDTSIDGKTVRSYSLLFDTNEKIALWVAFPHCGAYMGDASRTDSWAQDPKIPSQYQMQGTMDGYSRGHQLASSDRTSSTASNKLTFYYSNQTPQIQAFNGGVWVKMENQVRTWANACDTLYVVSGAVLKTVGGSETVTYIDDKAGGTNIAVPNYYYKVMLNLKDGVYKAAGYWFNQFDYDSSSYDGNIMSVDEIEALTGFDFFSNLNPELQDQIESVKSTADWAQ